MKVSIIVVNYKVKDKLLKCIGSIYASKPRTEFEIIVVDNSREEALKNELSNKFPKVKYILSPKNLGYGGGSNLGAKYARGEYLFFLNPDTKVFKGTIDVLVNFLGKNKKVGIVSPLILGNDRQPLKMQGYKEVNPVNSFFTFFFLRKMFRRFSFADYYSLEDWQREPIKKVETIYGAALMMRAELFERMQGFDKDYFLYFEENDLSKRARNLSLDLYVNSNSQVIHEIGQSTKQINERDKYFAQSRFLYFRKHFGITQAIIAESLIRINRTSLGVFLILILALILRLYNLSNGMTFIGDQGWFYLSARDILIHGTIPLVGITSSHTWLHQGPLWTYMLAIALFLSRFNPLSGGYVTVLFGILTTFLMYRLGKEMFSKRIGVIAALLYACSPLIIVFDRMPFDPGPIPFFTLMYFYAIYKWLKGNLNYFPIVLCLLAILYNLELSAFILFFPFVLIVVYGFLKKRKWTRDLLNKKIVLLSIILVLIPMLPILIYDFSHGFKQTIIFLGWTFYRPFSFLLKHNAGGTHASFGIMLTYALNTIQSLTFKSNLLAAVVLFFASAMYLLFSSLKRRNISEIVLFLLLFVSIAGILVNQTPSDAYLPIIFPLVIFVLAIFLSFLAQFKFVNWLVVLAVLIICATNSYLIIQQDKKPDLAIRISAVDRIIALASGQPYNLIGQGKGSQFVSYTMNYEYLLWWKGYPLSHSPQKLKIYVSETDKGIQVIKKP